MYTLCHMTLLVPQLRQILIPRIPAAMLVLVATNSKPCQRDVIDPHSWCVCLWPSYIQWEERGICVGVLPY